MDHEKKLLFLQNMAHMALSHAAKTPNTPTVEGKMSHDKMMAFVSGIATKGLQHFADGGTTLGGPVDLTKQGTTQFGGIGGAIADLAGSNNSFQASGTPIQAGTNTGQLNAAYTGAQGAIGAQQGVVNALNPGLNQGAGSQSTLTDMYLNQARGEGPNPALAQLNQATGQNIAAQAALMAGQRGAGANAGLIARQSAQQGAGLQQQAAGQAAIMQAQQQLAAQQNLQNLSANQIAQSSGAVQGLSNAQQNEQNILQGANTAFNNAGVSQQGNLNNVNAQIATANQTNNSNLFGEAAKGLAKAVPGLGLLFKAHGGEITKEDVPHKMAWECAPQMMAEGGIAGQPTNAPQSYVGQWLNSTPNMQGPGQQPIANINTNIPDPFAEKEKGGGGGAAEASPLAGFDPNTAASVGGAGATDLSALGPALMFASKGGGVPGNSKVGHDSIENDTVPAMLSPGEVVIDKDTLNDKGTIGKMARTVAAHIAKRNKKK